jgi:hypothetical protein
LDQVDHGRAKQPEILGRQRPFQRRRQAIEEQDDLELAAGHALQRTAQITQSEEEEALRERAIFLEYSIALEGATRVGNQSLIVVEPFPLDAGAPAKHGAAGSSLWPHEKSRGGPEYALVEEKGKLIGSRQVDRQAIQLQTLERYSRGCRET